MKEPGDAPVRGSPHDSIEPVGLKPLFPLAAPEQHRVEPDQAAVLDILDPPVGTEMGTPALKPFPVDRLTAVAGIADIMVPGDRAKTYPQAAHQLGGIPQILFDIGAVHGHVPRVDDEVGALLGDPTGKWGPVVCEMRLTGAQMGVRDLNYPHHSPRRKQLTQGNICLRFWLSVSQFTLRQKIGEIRHSRENVRASCGD